MEAGEQNCPGFLSKQPDLTHDLQKEEELRRRWDSNPGLRRDHLNTQIY